MLHVFNLPDIDSSIFFFFFFFLLFTFRIKRVLFVQLQTLLRIYAFWGLLADGEKILNGIWQTYSLPRKELKLVVKFFMTLLLLISSAKNVKSFHQNPCFRW